MEKFICKECDEEFSIAENLSKHVKHHGMNNREYYDKWLKKEDEEKCPICSEQTPFKSITKGYKKYCSLECKRLGAGNKTSETWKKRKTEIQKNYKFLCLECKERFKTSIKLTNHIIKEHGLKEYYDKYLKKEGEGICKICSHETQFYNRIDLGYRDCCSEECSNKYRFNNRSKTNLEKYKVENPFEIDGMVQKIKKTCLKKYGTESNMQSEKGQEEYKSSMNTKHGVDWPTQNKEILEKGQKSAKTLKKFRNTDIWYQGTYELDFLNKYYDKYPDIERGPSIKYIHDGKNKIYHPDFYITSLNLIIEIKSSWILNRDLEIEEKKKATIANGFKYLMILDKNYYSDI